MARDILSEYGPDSPDHEQARARCGGITEAKKLPYSPPVGPMGIMGNNHPGLGGHNYGNCGTQGPYGAMGRESGKPGIANHNYGHGSNRDEY